MCQQFANWGEVTNYAAAINGLDNLGTHELTTSLGRAISVFGVWSLTMNLQAKVLEPVSLWLVLRSFKSGWVRSPDGSTASVIIKCLKFGSSSFMFFSANHSLKDNMNCFLVQVGHLCSPRPVPHQGPRPKPQPQYTLDVWLVTGS